jgi:hypothetical protein
VPTDHPEPTRIFDRALLARRRDRLADGAHGHDFLLERVADDIAERLGLIRRRFPLAANIGAYHGLVSQRIRGTAGIERIVDVERSPRLLARCEGLRVVADEEALPFAAGSDVANQQLRIFVGGVVRTLTLDDKGAVKGNDKVKISTKNAQATFSLTLARSDFSDSLADEGLIPNATVVNVSKTVNVYVLLNNTVYFSAKVLSYSAKAGASGAAKQPQ